MSVTLGKVLNGYTYDTITWKLQFYFLQKLGSINIMDGWNIIIRYYVIIILYISIVCWFNWFQQRSLLAC